jgi:hypothetical protein
MKRILSLLSTLVIVLFAAAPVPLAAQDEGNQDSGISRRTARAPEPFKGFNSYEEFHGSVTSSETLLKLDSSLGYDFNQYAGVFVGVPLYFVHDSTPAAGEDLSGSATGDVYFGVDLYAPTPVVNYSTTFTISAPTGSVSKGFSTGHRRLDWTNRLRRKIGRVAPFLAAGISNTVPDSDLITRTFTSLGNVIHLEEGAEYDLTRRVYAGASAYHIIPFGTQNVVNPLNGPQPADRGPGNGNDGVGDGNAQAPPPASPAGSENRIRENGVDLWLGFEPTRVVRLEAGYSRSLTFALNRFSFNVGLNVGRLFKERAGQQ